VHVKTLRSQKLRMLLTHRKLLQSKAIAIENDLRGTLRNFGLKVGMVGTVRFEARIQELVETIPDLAVLVEPMLVRRALREQIVILHRRLLAIVRNDEERGSQLPAKIFLYLPFLPLAVEERYPVKGAQAIHEQVEPPWQCCEDHPWILRADGHIHHGKQCDDDAILGEMHVKALDPAHTREREGFLGTDLRCCGWLHIQFPQGRKTDFKDRSDRLQGFRAGVLPALDALDCPRAQTGQLGKLLLRPAALNPEFLDDHLRVFGHRLRPYVARDTTRHVSRATITRLFGDRVLSGRKRITCNLPTSGRAS
jgi:hypothetical protein